MEFTTLEELLQGIQDDKFYAVHLSGYSGSTNPWYHYNMNGPFDSQEEAVEKNYCRACGFDLRYPNKLGRGKDLKRLINYNSHQGRARITGNIFLINNPNNGDM
jgi:hypothetical protein